MKQLIFINKTNTNYLKLIIKQTQTCRGCVHPFLTCTPYSGLKNEFRMWGTGHFTKPYKAVKTLISINNRLIVLAAFLFLSKNSKCFLLETSFLERNELDNFLNDRDFLISLGTQVEVASLM